MLSLLSTKKDINKDKEFQQKKYEFEEKFNRVMFEINMFNKSNRTFKLNIIKETNYGFLAYIYNEVGLSLQTLSEKKYIIQENLQCLWIMQVEPFSNHANVKIVINKVDESINYENPYIKPHEMYLGLDFSLDVIKNNVNEYCMFLLAGAVGSGKTRLLYMILLSWILNCTPKEVELYIADIAKNEFVSFQNVQHVKCYAYELDQLHRMLISIKKKMITRKNIISVSREKGMATNIAEYNQTQNEKLPYIYILIDEFSVMMIDKSDSNIEKDMKQEIIDILKYISKIGRSLGVFCIIATQKTVRDEIPSIIKNMSAVRISFRANDSISSEVIMGDSGAMGLANRIAVYSLNGGEKKDYLFSPTIETNNNKLNKMLDPYIIKKQIDTRKPINDYIVKSKTMPVSKDFVMTKLNKQNKSSTTNSKPKFKEGDFIDY